MLGFTACGKIGYIPLSFVAINGVQHLPGLNLSSLRYSQISSGSGTYDGTRISPCCRSSYGRVRVVMRVPLSAEKQ